MVHREGFILKALPINGLSTGSCSGCDYLCGTIRGYYRPLPAVKSPPWHINLAARNYNETGLVCISLDKLEAEMDSYSLMTRWKPEPA